MIYVLYEYDATARMYLAYLSICLCMLCAKIGNRGEQAGFVKARKNNYKHLYRSVINTLYRAAVILNLWTDRLESNQENTCFS